MFINYQMVDNNFFPSKKIVRVKDLPNSVYTIGKTMGGELYVSTMDIQSDILIDLPEFISNDVINEITHFFKEEVKQKYERRGITYKRGILLYGKHGCGKTSIIMKIAKDQMANGTLVFFCPSPSMLSELVKIVRSIEGERKVLVIFEEFEKLVISNESEFLSLLDGETQIDNVVYIATTNYIKEIPNRIKDRPSRFATVIEVGLPNEETRKLYIQSKTFPDENVDIETWLKHTKGLTIDQIKDLIISVFCIGVDLKEAITRLEKNNVEKFEYNWDDDPYDVQ